MSEEETDDIQVENEQPISPEAHGEETQGAGDEPQDVPYEEDDVSIEETSEEGFEEEAQGSETPAETALESFMESEIEEEEEEEEIEEEEEEEEETYYDSDTFISGPVLSENSTIPIDILEFDFSYGYDCRKPYNLAQLDENTLIFASGNFINFFDVDTRTIVFRRSALGGGIGHIRKNPKYPHFAVAENGDIPLIVVYEWPTLEIFCVLKEGTTKTYTYLDYSPDGELLASQGGEPDYNITIWNWPKKKIMLRIKSYVNDVFRVKFSPSVPGHLTSCGVTHIKFWKMATTFTGLKLKGELGRFGKTEFSDVLGILGMPDEKVVSGCSWGNILLWDDGLIKLEVFRTAKRKCHDAPIVQIDYVDGELITVSMDGHVKIWWYEKIDQADPPDDDRTIQMEPTYDFGHPGLMLMSIKKRQNTNPEDFKCFAQDGNGGLWIIDLNVDDTPEPPVQLYKCHAGKIIDIAVCPWESYLVSLGEDGRIYLYDYLEKKRIFDFQFPAKGGSLLWLPFKISKYGDELIVGLDDGTLRTIILHIDEKSSKIHLVQAIKPHTKTVTAIAANNAGNVLVSGSLDSTIFMFKITQDSNRTQLIPIGFIAVPDSVTFLTWNCENDSNILVGCLHGQITQVTVLYEPQDYTQISYFLKTESSTQTFATYKSQIRRDEKIREIEEKKAQKVEKKRKELNKIREQNPGMEIDEDVYLADSEEDEELEPLYIPEVPNRVIWMESVDENTIALSMGGYDGGFFYEYKLNQDNEVPSEFYPMTDAEELEVCSYVYNHDKTYKIFGLQDGVIRVTRLNPDNPTDFSDYWTLSMHDNLNGFISKLAFSYDQKYLFSSGFDGNLFAYEFNYFANIKVPKVPIRKFYAQSMKFEDKYNELSLEQTKIKAEEDRIAKLANEHKQKLREKIHELADRYFKLLQRNNKLLPTQIIPREKLELDDRIMEFINNKLEEKLNLVKRKLSFDVEKSKVRMEKLMQFFIEPYDFLPLTVKGISRNIEVQMLKSRKLAVDHDEIMEEVEEKILEEAIKGRPIERAAFQGKAPPPKKEKEKRLEYFLMSLPQHVIDHGLGVILTKCLHKYRERKAKWEHREEEWEDFLAKKPAKGVNNPVDEVALSIATDTIGDFKLKSSNNFKPSKDERETALKKYRDLLITRKKQHDQNLAFNQKIYNLREEKVALKKDLFNLKEKLESIHKEIPTDAWKNCPDFLDVTEDCEFVEKNLEINVKFHLEYEEVKVPPVIVAEPSWDRIEKELLQGVKSASRVKHDPKAICEWDLKSLLDFGQEDNEETPWEKEIKMMRYKRKIYEQDQVISEMKMKISNFDEYIEELINEKMQVEVNDKMLDLTILTEHQELMVLKEFETRENYYQDKVNAKTTEVLDLEELIAHLHEKIKDHELEIVNLNGQISNFDELFQKSITDNKFADFLKRVYRKKIKPPKVTDDDDESSSSSSSSSFDEEEEDEASLDSRDFNIIRQDLNVCPKGCDPIIYDLTVSLRLQKFQTSEKVKEEQQEIESVLKAVDFQNKNIKVVRGLRETCMKELESYQQEKQHRLNEIRCTIILNLNQIQNLKADSISYIHDSLVFSKTTLAKLHKRVDELHWETLKETEKHRADVKHLMRMKTDIQFMNKQIYLLKLQVIEETAKKFGINLEMKNVEEGLLKRTFGKDNINDLEEVFLKKLVYDLRLSLINIKGLYMNRIMSLKKKTMNTQKYYNKILEENTAKIDLYNLLCKEKHELTEIVSSQEKKREYLERVEGFANSLTQELDKLIAVIDSQNQQIEDLKEEIKMLKTKGLPPRERKAYPSQEQLKEWRLYGQQLGIEEEYGEEEEEFRYVAPICEAEEIVVEIINELLDYLDTTLDKQSVENFVKDILSSIMRKCSVDEIMKDLIRNLPITPSDENMSVIETTAEQLFTLQAESDVKDILEEIVEASMSIGGTPEELIIKLLEQLIEHLPLDIVRSCHCFDIISDKVPNINKEEARNLAQGSTEEVRQILNEIMEFI